MSQLQLAGVFLVLVGFAPTSVSRITMEIVGKLDLVCISLIFLTD